LVTVRMTRMLWIWMAISVGVTSILIHSLY
jgi:hypothetical protein